MKVIKVLSEKTYENEKGEKKNYINFYLELDNGNRIPVLPNNKVNGAYQALSAVAYVEDRRQPNKK